MDVQSQPSPKDVAEPKQQDEQHSNHFVIGLLVLLPLFILSWFGGVMLLLCFWNWFLAPLGFKSLSFWSGLGIWLFFSFLKHNNNPSNKARNQDYSYWVEYIKGQYFVLGMFFALAWIAHLFTK